MAAVRVHGNFAVAHPFASSILTRAAKRAYSNEQDYGRQLIYKMSISCPSKERLLTEMVVRGRTKLGRTSSHCYTLETTMHI